MMSHVKNLIPDLMWSIAVKTRCTGNILWNFIFSLIIWIALLSDKTRSRNIILSYVHKVYMNFVFRSGSHSQDISLCTSKYSKIQKILKIETLFLAQSISAEGCSTWIYIILIETNHSKDPQIRANHSSPLLYAPFKSVFTYLNINYSLM
jgi:hypothetical protein